MMDRLNLAEFADRVNEYMRSIISNSLHGQDNELFKGRITMPQFIIMDYLLGERESNMTALARFMHVTTPAMTGMVERLVRERYLKRLYDKGDRRVIKVRLTARGTALVKKINAEKRRMIMRIFGKLTEKDRSNYIDILAKIQGTLTKA